MSFRVSTSSNRAWAFCWASSKDAPTASSDRSIVIKDTVSSEWEAQDVKLLTSVTSDEDRLAPHVFFGSGCHHRTAGFSRNIQFFDTQCINREPVVVRRLPFIGTGTVI